MHTSVFPCFEFRYFFRAHQPLPILQLSLKKGRNLTSKSVQRGMVVFWRLASFPQLRYEMSQILLVLGPCGGFLVVADE